MLGRSFAAQPVVSVCRGAWSKAAGFKRVQVSLNVPCCPPGSVHRSEAIHGAHVDMTWQHPGGAGPQEGDRKGRPACHKHS